MSDWLTSGNQERQNQWFQRCKAAGKPYVVVSPRTKFAWVEIDLIGQNYDLTPAAAREVRTLLMDANDGYQKLYVSAADTDRGMTFAAAGRIPKDRAAEVADRLVAIANDPANRQPIRERRRAV